MASEVAKLLSVVVSPTVQYLGHAVQTADLGHHKVFILTLLRQIFHF